MNQIDTSRDTLAISETIVSLPNGDQRDAKIAKMETNNSRKNTTFMVVPLFGFKLFPVRASKITCFFPKL
jgi:hypothetical protein